MSTDSSTRYWCRNKSLTNLRKSAEYKFIPRGYDKSKLNKADLCNLIEELHGTNLGRSRSTPRRRNRSITTRSSTSRSSTSRSNTSRSNTRRSNTSRSNMQRDPRNTRNTRSGNTARSRRPNRSSSNRSEVLAPRRHKKKNTRARASAAPVEVSIPCVNEESYLTLEPFQEGIDIVTLSLDSKKGHCFSREMLVEALKHSKVRRNGKAFYKTPMPSVWIDTATYKAIAKRSSLEPKLRVCRLRKRTDIMNDGDPVYTCVR